MTNFISSAITSIQNQLNLFEVVSIIVSVPAVVLGVYLTMTLYNLVLEQRRREFGLMKSKSVTTKNITAVFLLEAELHRDCWGDYWVLFGAGNFVRSNCGYSRECLPAIFGNSTPFFCSDQLGQCVGRRGDCARINTNCRDR